MTSAPATSFWVTIGTHTLTAVALSSAHLPGLAFYALQIPAGYYTTRTDVTIEAVEANGNPLVRNDPTPTSPLVPSITSTPGSNGPGQVWPLPGSQNTMLDSPAAVAEDFATQALGIQHPSVAVISENTADPVVAVDIVLPSTGAHLSVLASRSANGSWLLLQVGDQNQLRGITVLPGGHPGAVMALLPPKGSADADITEVASDGTHHIHLDDAQLATKTLHLTGTNIQSDLIVYRNRSGAVIDALGGTFG